MMTINGSIKTPLPKILTCSTALLSVPCSGLTRARKNPTKIALPMDGSAKTALPRLPPTDASSASIAYQNFPIAPIEHQKPCHQKLTQELRNQKWRQETALSDVEARDYSCFSAPLSSIKRRRASAFKYFFLEKDFLHFSHNF